MIIYTLWHMLNNVLWWWHGHLEILIEKEIIKAVLGIS